MDGPIVATALTRFRRAHGLQSLPLVALGASSGGSFVLQLAGTVSMAAVVSQIMAIPPAMLPPKMPPALFVHMARDQRTAQLVHHCLRRLRNESGKGAAAQIEVAPQRADADFFLRRIERLERGTAADLHAALQSSALLDGDGFLRQDPRGTAWREALTAHAGGTLARALPGPSADAPDSLEPDRSAVSEALNVCTAVRVGVYIPRHLRKSFYVPVCARAATAETLFQTPNTIICALS